VKTVGIIQARMGSTRLPGKVLMNLGGDTVLACVVRRVERARLVQEVLVATTESSQDSLIVQECDRLGVRCFRGSESDVLDRYYRAALSCSAETVVRVTSDCPLIDPALVDETIRVFLEQAADYGSNVFPRRYPRGLDTEVFTATALERAWREAREPHQREHVTPYFYEHPETFRIASAPGQVDHSQYRWTLDTAEDLELLRAIFASLGNATSSWREVLALMQAQPKLAELNASVVQKVVPAQASKSLT
jgi:spore coat polysaccharide biosynthesis protein SpsF